MKFELWDTAADRLVDAFASEAAALDAAYRALHDRALPAVLVRRVAGTAAAPPDPAPIRWWSLARATVSRLSAGTSS